MTLRLTVVCLFSLLALGCGESELDNKPTAKVEPVSSKPAKADKQTPEPGPAKVVKPAAQPEGGSQAGQQAAPSQPATAGAVPAAKKQGAYPIVEPDPDAMRDLVLDARRSSLKFVGRKVTKDHGGSFEDIAGTAKLRGFVPLEFQIAVQTRSVVTDHPDLTNHLKGADFFNTAKYPSARFTSTKIRGGGEGTATHTVTGELSMLAVTKRITFPATIVVTDAGATGLAEFKINRKDFGIVYPGRPDDLIADEVLLKLNLAYLDKKYVR